MKMLPYLLEKQGIQEWVDRVLDMLDQDRDSVPHAGLQLVRVSWLGLLEDLHSCLGFHGLHPRICLALGVKHERASLTVPRADRILNGRLIHGQAPEQPLPQLYE